ncbi:hypothetical protein E2C01_022593 [Portunus trituberculatus]|uniref:Uncharacterized protein n=1 Tax=Portunus trituberculatus TaxID=210409 RepID=A0A5B7E9A7_PORTR|nr:hypothetical protein [Portunus trituberculatus]
MEARTSYLLLFLLLTQAPQAMLSPGLICPGLKCTWGDVSFDVSFDIKHCGSYNLCPQDDVPLECSIVSCVL